MPRCDGNGEPAPATPRVISSRRELVGGGALALAALVASASGGVVRPPDQAADARTAHSAAGMVATGTPSATRAAVQVLEHGGNAVDAAAAALLALMVSDPANTSLGGRAQILIALADGRLVGLDGATQAPRRVAPLAGPDDARAGYAVAPIPGAPAALASIVAEYGRLPLAEVARPAIALARDGFVVTPRLAVSWERARDVLQRDPGAARHFLKTDGSAYAAGDRFRQPQLAEVLEQMTRAHAASTLYTGRMANAIAGDMTRHGGFVTLDDLAAYRPLPAPIVHTTYRGLQVAALGGRAWGDTLVEMLNILDEFPLATEEPGRRVEILARALHHALDDRPQELGTLRPKPAGNALATISSRAFARDRAALIRKALAGGSVPLRQNDRQEWHDTTHLAVMDGEGNAVSLTTSIGPTFGSRVASPALGFFYAHSYRMRADPTPDARDETEMTPTIVRRNGRPVLAIGAAGSERIPTAIVQVITEVVDRGASLEHAVAAPRLFSYGGTVRIEPGFDAALAARLGARGFAVEATDAALGTVQAVQYLDGAREFVGAADPRYDGIALGPRRLRQ